MKETTKFGIYKKRIEDVQCLYLKGYLDAHTAPILENTIQESLNNGDVKIIVNFGELDYISSAGLGVFTCKYEWQSIFCFWLAGFSNAFWYS